MRDDLGNTIKLQIDRPCFSDNRRTVQYYSSGISSSVIYDEDVGHCEWMVLHVNDDQCISIRHCDII